MKKYTHILVLFLIGITLNESYAQEKSKVDFDFGADLASRYVWRGLEFSDSPVLQPYVELNYKNLTVGAWASYETGGQVVGQEFDLYLSYSLGDFSIDFTDYSFPLDGATDNYFKMKTHIGEISLSYDNSDTFPLTLKVATNIYNDDQHSIYTEIGYPFKIKKIDLTLFVGAGNEQYSTNQNFTLSNFGLTASKSVTITPSFSINTAASVIFNPDTSDAYLVFLVSL